MGMGKVMWDSSAGFWTRMRGSPEIRSMEEDPNQQKKDGNLSSIPRGITYASAHQDI
jgi:hypothetical protein